MASQNPAPEGGKKGKKNKKSKVVLSLDEFNTELEDVKPSIPDGNLDWANDYETRYTKKAVQLPTLPRAFQDMSSFIDVNTYPHSPPFILALDNAPFAVGQVDLDKFFHKLPYKELILNVEFGKKQAPTIEFETRDQMIKAVVDRFNQEIGGRQVHLRTMEEMINPHGDRLGGRDGGRDRNQNRDDNMERSDIPEGEWIRGGPPAFPDRPQGGGGFDRDRQGSRQQQDRSDPSRGGDFEFKRNMDVQHTPSQPMRRDSRDERRDDYAPQRQTSYRDDRGPAPDRYRDNSPRNTFNRQPSGGFEDRGGYQQRSGPSSRDGGDRRDRPAYSTPYGELPPPGYDSRPPRRDNRDFSPRQQQFGRGGDRGGERGGRDQGFQRNDSRNDSDIIIQRSSFIPPPQPPRIVAPPPPANLNNRPPPAHVNVQPVVAAAPPPQLPPTPKERPKLQLAPRTVPLEETPAPASSSSAIFGGAKPVDTAAKIREIEEKKKRDEEEKQLRLTKEKEAAALSAAAAATSGSDSSSQPKQLLTHKGTVSISGGNAVDSIQQQTAQLNISNQNHQGGGQQNHRNDQRDRDHQQRDYNQYQQHRDNRDRPVASVPPFRKDNSNFASRDIRMEPGYQQPPQRQTSYNSRSFAEPPKPEPETHLQTSNRFALIQDDSTNDDPAPLKEPISRTTSVEQPEVESELGPAAGSDDDGGFQVVTKKKVANQGAPKYSRTFVSSNRGGGRGAATGSGGHGSDYSGRGGNGYRGRGGYDGNRRPSGGNDVRGAPAGRVNHE